MKLVKKLVGFGVAAAIGLTMVTGALADTKTQKVDVTIQGGGLNLEIPNLNPIGNITLTKDRDSYYVGFDGAFTIRDLTGTQAGWRLNASATPLTSGNHRLPAGSLTLKAPEAINTDPVRLGVTLPEVLTEEKSLDTGAVTVAEAEQGTGMGSFKLSFKDDHALGLHIDALTAKEGTYESTITWNLVTAP